MTNSAILKTKSEFLDKLPQITAAFWLMKIIATTLGETGGDWLSMTMNVGYLISTVIFFVFFVVMLSGQLMSKKYHPFLYWSVIIATSTAGTTMSDYMDRTLELGYTKGAAILITALLCILAIWKITAGSINVSDIRTRAAELFYWFAILVSNTLGTALGDFLADDSGLGFLSSWLLITAVLAIVLGAALFTKTNRVFLFWLAFILTRPFGATFGDVLTKTSEKGGLDFGRGYSSLILLAMLIAAILLFHKSQNKDVAVQELQA